MKDVKLITEEVAKLNKIKDLQQYAADESIEVTIADDAKPEDARTAIIEAATKAAEEDDKQWSKLTPKQIVAALIADDSRDVDTFTRTIKVVNKVTTLTGENGEYDRATITLTKMINGYVAVNDPDEGLVWQPGKTDMIMTMVGSIIATIKNNAELAPYFDVIRNNPKEMLNIILSGTTVKIVAENVKADEDYVNPFSSTGTAKNYDHDWVAVNVYEIVSLGKAAKEWLALRKLASAGAFENGNVIKSLLGI